MKYRALIILIVIAITCAGTGCKKSSSAPASTNFMKAKINGQDFNGKSVGSSISGTRLTLTGSMSASLGYPQIVLSAGVYNGTGMYDLGLTANYGSLDSSFTTSSQIFYGNFTVTATDPNITGTFSFTCFDSTKVTEGTFSCPKL
jgi:hypothetical protein